MTHPEYTPTPTVLAMNKITFRGNIIPLTWYHHLKYDDGKAHLAAISILADIVYWYRPYELRDERTGDFIRLKCKFKGDMLQMGYDQFAERFGLTKIQAKSAINYLIDQGLVHREFRTIRGEGGLLANNVMFVEPIPSGIERINDMPLSNSNDTPIQSKLHRGTIEITEPIEFKVETNTEITTKTTTETTTHPSMSAVPKKDEQTQQSMDGWMDEYQNPKFIFLMGCDVMDINTIRELMVLPLETLQNQWAIVKNSTKINDKPGMLVSNLRKLVKLEAAKQRAAAERAANPEAAQTPVHVHADANRYQRPDFITEAEWYGLSDIPAVYALLDGAQFDGGNGIECRTPQQTDAFYRKYDGANVAWRFAAVRNWRPDGEEW